MYKMARLGERVMVLVPLGRGFANLHEQRRFLTLCLNLITILGSYSSLHVCFIIFMLFLLICLFI